RCTELHMRPVPDKDVRKYLMETLHVPDYQADICIAFARGNIGKAKSLAMSEEFENIKREAITVLKYIHEMDIGELAQSIKKLNEYKVSISDYLDIMIIWYRDVLLFKATNDANDLIFKEEVKYIRERANQSAYEGIETIIQAIKKTKIRLEANVNFDLAIELLMLTIKEN
ncbi:MAG TPA: DNA polymerase III subunit delta, partial [Lachnospiraceae bacterium]|nr:DNA polymerase III subunit delta [Lachnospiraceae bacterium]